MFAANAAKRNRDVFGNIFHKRKRCLARLAKVQHNLSRRCIEFYSSLEQELIKEYNEVLRQEVFCFKNQESIGLRKGKEIHISSMPKL